MTQIGAGAPQIRTSNMVDKWLSRWDELRVFEAGGLTDDESGRESRRYIVNMFPYPSGDLHMGHAEVYSVGDAIARYSRLRGFNVLHPIAWDSFGLPAENAAIKRRLSPSEWTHDNIAVQAESFRRLGVSFDWRTRFHTSDTSYYRWNQWLFLKLYEHGLAYRRAAPVNWCPVDKTVLANEQVIAGACERCGATVVQRNLTQWFFRITAYAQRLLDDMEQLSGQWPEEVLKMQRNWIGRSVGAYLDFAVDGLDYTLQIFTTRAETAYGATFLAVAARSAVAAQICAPEYEDELREYQRTLPLDTDYGEDRAKDGVFLGRWAANPVNGQRVPVYAAAYVQGDYGTGAIMGVPAHDDRDRAFAQQMDLPIVEVVASTGSGDHESYVLRNSGAYDGMSPEAARVAITQSLEADGAGRYGIVYRLRDWLLSRQRYWGTPIPIVYCSVCGEVPVPVDQLPVVLPAIGSHLGELDGQSPLQASDQWVDVPCPTCGGTATRDTDTMDTFVDSSWYFLRFPNRDYENGPFDPRGIDRWLPVDEYLGGREHATGHLLYARFLTKVLCDLGLLRFSEPFRSLINQGQVIMDGRAMSKSLGNLVNLQEQLALNGPDAIRVAMCFAGPPEDDVDWADVSPTGAVKWINRVLRLAEEVGAQHQLDASNSDDTVLQRRVHRLMADVTECMDGKRLNVAIARLMELTSALRKAVESGVDVTDAVVREGTESLVCMLSCFAPFAAEEAWEHLGYPPSVAQQRWPEPDPALLEETMTTCVVQVAGKVRDRLTVKPTVAEEELRSLALRSDKVVTALHGAEVRAVVVRAPHLVNVVPG